MKTIKVNPSLRLLLIFIIFLAVVDLSVVLDIPLLRQFGGFFLFTITPGLLILGLLRVERLGLAERAVIAIGLSISFIIFFGLAINQLYPALGYATPLSTPSVTISYSVALLVLALAAHFKNRLVASFPALSSFTLDDSEKKYLLLPAFLPLLGIIGTHVMNATDNNFILMLVLLAIPAYLVFIAIRRAAVPERIYPALVLLFSVAMVVMTLLRSQYVLGADIHTEYYLYQITASAQRWQIYTNLTLDICLVINLLPAIYNSFLSMPPAAVFNLLTYLLLALTPLVVFIISRRYIGSLPALLSAFFFMSQLRFQTFGGSRNDAAIFYFAITIMIVFLDRLSGFQKKLLFFGFAASCVVSHYSATYIFLFILVLAWLGWQGINAVKVLSNRSGSRLSSHRPEYAITTGMLMVFMLLIYLWYSQVSYTTFVSGVDIIYRTLSRMGSLFVIELYDDAVKVAMGYGLATKGIPHHIEFVFSWLTILLITAGLIGVLLKQRALVKTGNNAHGTGSAPLLRRLDGGFLAIAASCYLILVLSTVVPYLTKVYDMGRIYFQMTAVLAPLLMVGAAVVVKVLWNRRTALTIIVALVVLIPFFTCTSDTLYQFFGFPRKIVLNSAGSDYLRFYVYDEERYAAQWLAQKSGPREIIYAWDMGAGFLSSQGMLPKYGRDRRIYEFYPGDYELRRGYIYLRYSDTVPGRILEKNLEFFSDRDVLYSNGKAVVYK
ncbi:MAG: DUF2206 domain-containing protein [Dehalococcoidales bacterium]|nr:DUF2206 domain-containing protein [Dehalococcoidales bacterium]